MKTPVTTTILLIDDDPLIATNIKIAINHDNHAPRHAPARFQITWKQDLAAGLDYLQGLTHDPYPSKVHGRIHAHPSTAIAAIIVGLKHVKVDALETCHQLLALAPETPLLWLVNADTPPFDQQALHKNMRGRISRLLLQGGNTHEFFHVLHRAIERTAMERSLNRIESTLQTERQRFQAALASVSDGVLAVDNAGKVTHMNAIAEELTGWPLQEALGKPLTEVFNVLDGKTRAPLPYPALQANNPDPSSILLHRDGREFGIKDTVTPIHDDNGSIIAALLAFRNADEGHDMAHKMAYLAQHDALTGLPNRTLMHDRLVQTLILTQRHQRKAALLYIDLDHFKNINDTLGHAIGDKLLQCVAERLQSCVRHSDTVSRQGGDEFLVLLSEIEHAEDVAICAEKMLKTLAAPIIIDDHQLYISLSIGIGICPEDGTNAETLMVNADTAMYHAKTGGRANFQFFRQSMNEQIAHRQQLANKLRDALDQSQFVLHYQPKVNLQTGIITGVEALVRWCHPEQGLMSPATFVSIAEECGLMQEIGRWVLHEACRQAQAWLQAGLDIQRISVNVSSPEFRNRNFIANLQVALEQTGLPGSRLELELTESALMSDSEGTRSRLMDIRQMGIRIAIDDFGTGYTSLTQLKNFPIDTLKIDRSFVQCMTEDPADAAIVSAVIDMGRQFNYRVVAEGVETQAQHQFLQSRLCDETQGHHFSRPLSAMGFETLLKNHHPELH